MDFYDRLCNIEAHIRKILRTTGFSLPPDPSAGEVLTFSGTEVYWGTPAASGGSTQQVLVEVDTDNQTTFVNAIPTGKTLVSLSLLGGVTQVPNVDYHVTGRTIIWDSTDFPLLSSYTLILIVE